MGKQHERAALRRNKYAMRSKVSGLSATLIFIIFSNLLQRQNYDYGSITIIA
jgi:hypothetical protein